MTAPASNLRPPRDLFRLGWLCPALILFFGLAPSLLAAPTLTSWEPKFKGVDLCVGSNLTATADFPNRQAVYALRVDLTDPDIKLFTTPRITNYTANSREIASYTVSDFLRTNKLQAAINANLFSVRNYYLTPGTPMDVYGYAVSTGQVVSPQQNRSERTSLIFDSNNVPTLIATNWPAVSDEGVYTAVTGGYPLVINGTNVARRTDIEPRTAFGYSKDKRYLYILAVDGRQLPYSAGAYNTETANWMILLGAHDAVNMDGGGSTTLVLESSTGAPVRINKSSAVADSGRERTVGSHFGIYAKPVPDFIYDVAVAPEDVSARITFKTLQPSAAEIRFGATEDLGEFSQLNTLPTNSHSITLTGLLPSTGYYYQISSLADGVERLSPLFHFITTNYISTLEILNMTNSWKHTSVPQSGAGWASLNFDDSDWTGPDPALLWIDARPTGPNPDVQPKGTELAADPSNSGLPYLTYYFRAPLHLSDLSPGSSLAFKALIDDGAVVYLNGVEIQRIRMPEESASDTLATTFPCEGDATCLDEFTLLLSSLPSAVMGENILAVEVHNYHPFSSDITFGLSVDRIDPLRNTALEARYTGQSLILSWNRAGMTLQTTTTLAGPWEDVPNIEGTTASFEATGSTRFFRLRQ